MSNAGTGATEIHHPNFRASRLRLQLPGAYVGDIRGTDPDNTRVVVEIATRALHRGRPLGRLAQIRGSLSTTWSTASPPGTPLAPSQARQGSIPPAAAFEYPQREIVSVIERL